MQWFEVAAFVGMHTAAAWEDGNKVHLVVSRCDIHMYSTHHASLGLSDSLLLTCCCCQTCCASPGPQWCNLQAQFLYAQGLCLFTHSLLVLVTGKWSSVLRYAQAKLMQPLQIQP